MTLRQQEAIAIGMIRSIRVETTSSVDVAAAECFSSPVMRDISGLRSSYPRPVDVVASARCCVSTMTATYNFKRA